MDAHDLGVPRQLMRTGGFVTPPQGRDEDKAQLRISSNGGLGRGHDYIVWFTCTTTVGKYVKYASLWNLIAAGGGKVQGRGRSARTAGGANGIDPTRSGDGHRAPFLPLCVCLGEEGLWWCGLAMSTVAFGGAWPLPDRALRGDESCRQGD